MINGLLRTGIVAASLMLFGLDAGVSAQPQSLGDVARRESERRSEAAKRPGRVYTNGDLAAIDSPDGAPGQAVPSLPSVQETASAPAVSPEAASTTEQQPTTATTSGAAHARRDEEYWRARAKGVRERLAKASADLESIRSNLSALDNGPKTPAAARERALVAAAVQRLQSEVRSRQLEETRLRAQAEIDKIPAEWIQ